MSECSGFLLILSGPSGSGKDSVIREILKRDDKTVVSVSMTTRAPRNGEKDGRNYFFISRSEFDEHIRRGEMLEWAAYGDNYYGTPKEPLLRWISEGKTVILKIEVQGADKIKQKYPCVRTLFLMPPSMHILKKRLLCRNTESPDELRLRLETAKKEIGRANDYDYIVVNNRLQDTVDDVLELILRHRRHLRSAETEAFYYGHQFKDNFTLSPSELKAWEEAQGERLQDKRLQDKREE